MVRLVFRPYTQIRRSICTSESLRASTRVSSGFALFRHSSPSFGSQRARSTADPSREARVRASVPSATEVSTFVFAARSGLKHPNTRARVRLLGPCFKTGRSETLCQRPKRAVVGPRGGLAASPRREARAAILGPNRRMRSGAITHPWGCHVRPDPCATAETDADPSTVECASANEIVRRTDPRPTRLTRSVSLSAISRTV